ncbi:MAG: hypothetical protein J6S14_22140 [Clostridia bacterium]|nr:hypothetical protein [Clostridia bacterium]
MTPKYTEDKRLLGALDYIDEKYIAEVTESYKIFEPSDGKITARRTLKISLRQFAALAACLILLSAAFPVTNYVVKAIKNFAAGWGSLNEYGSKYDRAIDAYPTDMPVEDIYEDVLKGGWVVCNDDEIHNLDLMFDFYTKAMNGEESSVLVASYYHLTDNLLETRMDLKEITFDGSEYNLRSNHYYRSGPGKDTIMSEEIYTREYHYLILDDFTLDDGVYLLLSDDNEMTAQKLRSIMISSGPKPTDTLLAIFLLHINQDDYDQYLDN